MLRMEMEGGEERYTGFVWLSRKSLEMLLEEGSRTQAQGGLIRQATPQLEYFWA